jgi:ribosomal protein S18 acetylase RimI-like enzyme
VIVDECVEADVQSIVSLWQACGLTRPWNDPHKDIQFAMASETSTILVGKAEGRIMASVMVGHDGHRGVWYYLAVDPMFQKRGFGRILHNAAVDWLKTRGVWKINLMVRAENKTVSGFYEALGYEINPVASLGKRID